ncbi:PKD domain-containing protein [Pseudoalteromonas spongiae]|uniref:Cadherin domain-containing protein n=1 Tax=Pseudoalteromonas spongiae TaxID=298657 RepID=A0ABU8EQ28_9GAMM
MKFDIGKLSAVLCMILITACGGGGEANTNTKTSSNHVQNVLPVVDAGQDIFAFENEQVTLSASASDSDGNISSVAWRQIEGDPVDLSSASELVTTFTSPEVDTPKDLIFEIVVKDDQGATARDSITVTVEEKLNQAPVINLVDRIDVISGSIVNLNASINDLDGDISNVLWTQIAGSTVVISNADTPEASFIAPQVTEAIELKFELTVTDDDAATTKDNITVLVNKENSLPIVSAGEDIIANPGGKVNLLGVASDIDGQIDTVIWKQLEGKEVDLVDYNTLTPSFDIPEVALGSYFTFQVEVTDNRGGQAVDSIKVTVQKITPTTPELVVTRLGYPGRIKLNVKGDNQIDSGAKYNLFYAKQAGVRPDNYSSLAGGKVIRDISLPYEIPSSWNEYQNTFFVLEKELLNTTLLSNEVNTSHRLGVSNWNRACVVEASTVICWGRYDNQERDIEAAKDPIILSNPSQLAVGSVDTCVIDSNELKCWGDNLANNIPELVNPFFINIEGSTACAIDNSGHRCWGELSEVHNGISLKNPKEIVINDYSQNCALDDTGVVCWNNSGQLFTELPKVKNPHSLDISNSRACLLDNNKLVCWGGIEGIQETEGFENPSQVIVTNLPPCVLDDNGVNCLDDDPSSPVQPPELNNPRSLFGDDQYYCSADTEGLQCWGYPEAVSNNMPNSSDLVEMDLDQSEKLECYVSTSGLTCYHYGKQINLGKNFVASDIDVERNTICVIEGGLISCFDVVYGKEIMEVKEIAFDETMGSAKEIYLDMFGSGGCTLFELGTSCVGLLGYSSYQVETIKSIAMNSYTGCVLTDNGHTSCGTDKGNGEAKSFYNSNAVGIANSQALLCHALPNSALCLDLRYDNEFNIELANNVKQIEGYDGEHGGYMELICALDDNGVSCWQAGEYASSPLKYYPSMTLFNPSRLSKNVPCAVDDYGLACWGISPYYGYGQRSNPRY